MSTIPLSDHLTDKRLGRQSFTLTGKRPDTYYLYRLDETFADTPQEGTLFSPPLWEISTFTKLIPTPFSTPLRGEKQGMNF
jgi:hypothetical protein